MKKWKCSKCGKELVLENVFYFSCYKDKKKCLECSEESFSARAEKSDDGGWKIYIPENARIESIQVNDSIDFRCEKCDKKLVLEKSLYDTLYEGENLCWECRQNRRHKN